MIDNYFLIGSC